MFDRALSGGEGWCSMVRGAVRAWSEAQTMRCAGVGVDGVSRGM